MSTTSAPPNGAVSLFALPTELLHLTITHLITDHPLNLWSLDDSKAGLIALAFTNRRALAAVFSTVRIHHSRVSVQALDDFPPNYVDRSYDELGELRSVSWHSRGNSQTGPRMSSHGLSYCAPPARFAELSREIRVSWEVKARLRKLWEVSAQESVLQLIESAVLDLEVIDNGRVGGTDHGNESFLNETKHDRQPLEPEYRAREVPCIVHTHL